jgi:hypothetical protein
VAEANKFKLIAEAEGQADAIINVFKAIHAGDLYKGCNRHSLPRRP